MDQRLRMANAQQLACWKSLEPERKMSIDDWLYEREKAAIEWGRVCNNGGQPERWCECPELIINGKRVPCPPHHDCDYVRKRSELVAIADRITSEGVGNKRGIVNGYRWTRRFVTEMEKLAAPLLKNGAQAA